MYLNIIPINDLNAIHYSLLYSKITKPPPKTQKIKQHFPAKTRVRKNCGTPILSLV